MTEEDASEKLCRHDAIYGVFMPIMLALCLIAYCGLGVVGWVMDFFGVDSE